MHPITSNISIEDILIQKSKMFSSNFLRNPQSFIQKLIKCEQTSDIEMWCRGSWFALFQGRLAQSLSWRPPKVQTHKFPANNIQIEFGNEYNSARLKLHSYVNFVWYLINGDLDQFLKITKSQKFSAWMVQIFHKMPKRVCSNWWKMKEKQEEQKSGSRSWASVTFFNSCNKLSHVWFF